MSYLGSWKIDDLLTFYANTTRFDTGVATDADSVPTYRVYEDETGTPLLTGSMALLDSANTAGFYSEQITLSAANGFEKGKCYAIYLAATVNSVAGAAHHTFQMEAEVDANVVSDKTSYALTSGERTSIADALLNRDMSAVSDTNARSPLNALRFLRNKWSISGTTLTVTEEDDSTTAWTSTLTADASANPITASDPG